PRVEQQRRDVLEQDARLGKIGHVADGSVDILDCHGRGHGRASQLFDIEVVREHELMWNIASFHMFDLRMRRPLLEHAPELLECLRCPGGAHFHGAVAQIAYEAAQTSPLRFPQHEPAEPHSLYPAVHEEPQGDHSRGLTPAAPATRAAGTTRRTLPR